MKSLYGRTILFSVIGALGLSFISLFCMVKISDLVVEDYRYGYLLYVAKKIERTSEVTQVNMERVPALPVPKDSPLSLVELTEFGHSSPNGRTIVKPSLWLVDEDGKILSTNTQKNFPVKWAEAPLPKRTHGIISVDRFILSPKTFIVRLNTIPQTFLVSHNEKTLFQGPFLWIQGIHTFTTAALAVIMALSLCFYYLRRKSREAREVLGRLEGGDLKARFEIKRFDQFGNLILDFNRMADQIERLVGRLSETEASRSDLLQELGHDLRTPLTSLTTSFETLEHHHDVLEKTDRDELYTMIGADIRYFKDLLEKLTVVATIEGPHYKSTTENINLTSLLEEEIANRQTSSPNLQWRFSTDPESEPTILGDPHLVTRLFKNAFDNASRYAQSLIQVRLKSHKDTIEIEVRDDGPGLSPEAIHGFGKRRERRHVKDRNEHDFSLGLGSVIMKAIAEAHDGTIEMANLVTSATVAGACLRITFRKP